MPITTCNSPGTLRAEIDAARKKVSPDETEDTWNTIAQGLIHITSLCNNGGCEFPSDMVAGIRSISRPLNSAINSERSRLSGAAIELLTALATGLGSSFEPLVPQFVPTLLALCGRTNKVFTSRARACILAIVQHTRLPCLLPYLAELANHKSAFPRLTAAEGILACLNCFNPPDLEKEARARIVEDFIKLTARDASADVRKASKEIFKAYKLLLPARVDSFVAPLTPVVKKYLDIRAGPSGTHVISSNAGQKQSSRPSSRANNIVMGSAQLSTTSTISKPPTRLATDDSAQTARQRPAVHASSSAADIRVPRQRTTSQLQRDLPQPRNLHINVQPSGAAQRCVVPASAPVHQAVRHPMAGVARIPPARSAPSNGGPQRPPPMQIKFNPPPDRFKVTGNGAQRIPLPPVPVNGNRSEVAVKSADRANSPTDIPQSRVPGRSAEAGPSGKSGVNRKTVEVRPTSSLAKLAKGPIKMAPTALQRSQKPSTKGEPNNSVKYQRRHAGNVQKGTTRPLVKAERKEKSPALIPLPPSPSTSPTEIPLPPSPGCESHPTVPEAEVMAEEESTNSDSHPSTIVEPCPEEGAVGNPSTPITALLSSIQRGFLLTPSSPLSPPQNYLPAIPGDMLERQNAVRMSDNIEGSPGTRAHFCIPLEDVDGLDIRHALKDLN